VVATLRSGRKALPHWKAGKASYDWTDAKADALAILEAAGMDTQKVQISRGAPEYYHPGQSGVISLGPKKILGYFGTLHPLTCEAMDVPAAMVACEIFTDEVPPQKTKAPKALEVSDLQPVSRDFAFLLPADKAAGDLLAAIRKSHDLITDAWLFDVYRGEHVQEGFVSLALGIQIQPVESTLTDADIEAISTAVIKAAESKGGSLRG
jgi:phenylalanyl-tRNA synthetase beta chain